MHFTVLVVGEEPELQLEPFQENNMGDCPPEFLQFLSMEDELADEYELNRMIESPEGDMKPIKELYPTFESFAEEYHGFDKDPRMRKYGYWENPNSRWDWYELGGRWTGAFKLKDGAEGVIGGPSVFRERAPVEEGFVDQARKGDIDWEGTMAHDRTLAEETWDKYKDKKSFLYNIYPEETREEYLSRVCQFTTHAILMDGEWSEKEGYDKETDLAWSKSMKKIIDSLPDDTLLSVYDCHV